jgi:uncharacterized protein YbaR (Trm112 family)/ubiquinone/menaquinone biosynthesis C-methylase UbiE
VIETGVAAGVLTDILACPGCQGRLASDAGGFRCERCAARYPVEDGIPVFLTGRTAGQEGERAFRDRLASRQVAGSAATLLETVGHHHCMRVMARRAARFAARFTPGQWILDLGIGWGWHWRSRVGPRVFGVDMSLGNLRLARRLLGPGRDDVALVCADAAALPLRSSAVSGAWSVQVLQHMPAGVLERAIAELDRVMADEGRIEISNLNPGLFQRAAYHLAGRRLHLRGAVGEMELTRRSAAEWRAVWRAFRPGRARVVTGYSELFFHPDLHVRPRPYPAALERALAAARPVAGLFARQVDVVVTCGGRD